MMSTTRMFAAAVALSGCAVAAFAVAPASAMPSVKQGVTLESPLVQQAGYWKWKKKRHCHYVKKVSWKHGHKHVKYVKVCR